MGRRQFWPRTNADEHGFSVNQRFASSRRVLLLQGTLLINSYP